MALLRRSIQTICNYLFASDIDLNHLRYQTDRSHQAVSLLEMSRDVCCDWSIFHTLIKLRQIKVTEIFPVPVCMCVVIYVDGSSHKELFPPRF